MSIQTTLQISKEKARSIFLQKKREEMLKSWWAEFDSLLDNEIEDYIEEYFYNVQIKYEICYT